MRFSLLFVGEKHRKNEGLPTLNSSNLWFRWTLGLKLLERMPLNRAFEVHFRCFGCAPPHKELGPFGKKCRLSSRKVHFSRSLQQQKNSRSRPFHRDPTSVWWKNTSKVAPDEVGKNWRKSRSIENRCFWKISRFRKNSAFCERKKFLLEGRKKNFIGNFFLFWCAYFFPGSLRQEESDSEVRNVLTHLYIWLNNFRSHHAKLRWKKCIFLATKKITFDSKEVGPLKSN